MTKIDIREFSRRPYKVNHTPGEGANTEYLKLSADLRIADALEQIAKDKIDLESRLKLSQSIERDLQSIIDGQAEDIRKIKASRNTYKSQAKRWKYLANELEKENLRLIAEQAQSLSNEKEN